jgi:DNA replication protein DnaC
MLSEEIREIDSELVGTGPLIFKTACEGKDITPIKERNQALMKRRRELLVSFGYPEDYTEIKYHCPICSDSGYTVEGRMCSCFREALLKENIKSSGIGSLIEKQSFDNFDLSVFDDETVKNKMSQNLEAARNFAENFGRCKDRTLLMIGKTGTGKTHLSTAIAKTVIEAGYEVLYDSAQNIISAFESDRFRSGYGQGYEPKGDKYLECDLLILDDLGAEFSNQFTVSCLYNLINTRQNKGLATVISTNLYPKELSQKYEDRITSRLLGADTRTLLFVGKDYRIASFK